MTAITQETLSVSGILLAKSFNQQARRDRPLRRRERHPDRPAGAAADERPVVLRDGADLPRRSSRRSSTSSPAWLLLGDVPVTAGHDRRLHHRAGAADVPAAWGSCASPSTCRPRSALFARIFEYLDLKPAIVDRPERAMPVRRPRAGSAGSSSTTSSFRYPDAERRRAADPRRRLVRDRAGPVRGLRRPVRRGQDDGLLPDPAAATRRPAARVRFAGDRCARA